MLKEIDITALRFNPFEKIGKQWFLVAAGDEASFNAMTCSWGYMGVMWNKNVVQAVIRPQRATRKFLEKQEFFTVSFYPESCKSNLRYCGSHSANTDPDKMANCGLTPAFIDGVPYFEEAETVLLCRKLYCQQLSDDCFTDKTLSPANYAAGDFHYAYIGEIVKAYTK